MTTLRQHEQIQATCRLEPLFPIRLYTLDFLVIGSSAASWHPWSAFFSGRVIAPLWRGHVSCELHLGPTAAVLYYHLLFRRHCSSTTAILSSLLGHYDRET